MKRNSAYANDRLCDIKTLLVFYYDRSGYAEVSLKKKKEKEHHPPPPLQPSTKRLWGRRLW